MSVKNLNQCQKKVVFNKKLVSPEFGGDEGRRGSTLKADFMQ